MEAPHSGVVYMCYWAQVHRKQLSVHLNSKTLHIKQYF